MAAQDAVHALGDLARARVERESRIAAHRSPAARASISSMPCMLDQLAPASVVALTRKYRPARLTGARPAGVKPTGVPNVAATCWLSRAPMLICGDPPSI